MTNELKEQWIAALRSGEYRQATGALEAGGEYCCLGVLCKVAGQQIPAYGYSRDRQYQFVNALIGKSASGALKLMNDHDRASFAVIADWIEKNVLVEVGAPRAEQE